MGLFRSQGVFFATVPDKKWAANDFPEAKGDPGRYEKDFL